MQKDINILQNINMEEDKDKRPLMSHACLSPNQSRTSSANSTILSQSSETAQVSYGNKLWTNRQWDNLNKRRTNTWNRTGSNQCSSKLDTPGKCMPKGICRT
eukprot:9162771-Ditylum_brightwellii.AAC.1